MKKKQKPFGLYGPSRYIVSQIPDALSGYKPLEETLKIHYQRTIDQWGAERRAFLSDCQLHREMKEKRISMIKGDRNYEEDYILNWGRNPLGGLK